MLGLRTLPRLTLTRLTVVFALGALAACTSETPVPIDLTNSTVPTTTLQSGPNAAQQKQAQDLADQQCLDQPDLEQGVIRVVDPDTDQVFAEFLADCDEVRGR